MEPFILNKFKHAAELYRANFTISPDLIYPHKLYIITLGDFSRSVEDFNTESLLNAYLGLVVNLRLQEEERLNRVRDELSKK